ncbi:phage minor head protein [uncultured Endozoicomonas sp.]|uniref:phage minor head protein n=1 Tax=uncultured Endozoicomonas sp. TaxID=432652 RepID=UPI002615BF9B|nr:phage minor head protein [uncultured Endozoicomonas sp.]
MAKFTFSNDPPPEVLAFFENKKLKPSFNWADVWKQEHQSAFTVAKAMKLDVLQDVRDGVLKAIAEGQTLQQFRKELTPLLQEKGWWGKQEMTDPLTGELVNAQLGSPRRLRVIYETNLRTAHAAGQWDRVQRTKKTHPYLLYELGPSREHRKEHLRWNGLLLPADDSFWNTHYPQNGWGCKCRVRQVSKAEYERIKGKSHTEAPEIKRQEWTNNRTGEILEVPEGIDPGWDYNPGKGRLTQYKKQVKQKEKQLKKALAEPLPKMAITAPAPFSTVKNANGEQINRVLNELGTDSTRQAFNDFLAVHPIKSCLLKATEMTGKKAVSNKALQAKVGDYLGVAADDAFMQYGRYRGSNRINGFTRAGYDLVNVKVQAGTNLTKADPVKIKEAVIKVLDTATNNNGPRKIYAPASTKYTPRDPDNYLHRHWSVSDVAGVKSPEQIITTWLHEVGHQVHFWGEVPVFPGQSRTAFLTEYSRSNNKEWFAEHFTAWYIDPKGFRQWNAEAADFIETTLKTATANTNPRLKGR